MIIAVDGPSAAGKGTLARRLAAHFDFAHLDTGMLYRAVARAILSTGGDPADAAAAAAAARELDLVDAAAPGLRDEEVGEVASIVSAHAPVRAALVDLQRHFAHAPPGGKRGAVLDGRDIGTVICPEADAKIFVTASPEARARRRYNELLERGEDSIYARVLQQMRDRDERDRERATAPLTPAPDALVLDTTAMDAERAFATALAFIEARASD